MSKNDKNRQSIKISQSTIIELQNVRIIQKNLLYVIGLSSSICDRELLMKKEYFGQYGKIKRLVVNNMKAYNPDGVNGPSFSAYISYSTSYEASLALLSIDNTLYDEHILKASFGSTKYCLHFLRNIECTNKDCLFLHSLADEKDIINKDDTNNKNMFLQNQFLAMKICDIFSTSVRNKITDKKNHVKNAEFPTINTIYLKEIVIEADPKNKKIKKFSDHEETYQSNKENLEKNEPVTNSQTDNEKNDTKRILKEDLKNLLNKNKTVEKSIPLNNPNIISNFTKSTEINSTSYSLCSNDNSTNSEKTVLQRNNSDYSNYSEITDFTMKKRKSVYLKKDKSRFMFATENSQENKEEDTLNLDFVCDYISFKTSTYFYFKKVEVDEYIYTKYKINTSEWQKILDLNRGEYIKN